jgi:hypothetical protein
VAAGERDPADPKGEPPPTGPEAAPDDAAAAAKDAEPAPKDAEPAPRGPEPAPKDAEPAPRGAEPAAKDAEPVPARRASALPRRLSVAPAKRASVGPPRREPVAPAKRESVAPRGDAPRDEPPGAPGEYEFSDLHKDSFRALGASMSFVGVCTMMFALLSAVFALGEVFMGFVPNAIGTAAAAGLDGVMAWWMLAAGRSLSGMVRTRGRDVVQLMEAVVQLRRLFGLARVVIIVLAMGVTIGGAAVVWCNFVVERGGKCFGGMG